MTNLCDDEPTSDVLQLRESWTQVMQYDNHSVLPRPFSEGGTPCRFLVTPCPIQEAEMTPCPFLVTPNEALLHFT